MMSQNVSTNNAPRNPHRPVILVLESDWQPYMENSHVRYIRIVTKASANAAM